MTKKIHILQVVGAMNRGGAEVMLMDIFRNLSNNTQFSFLVNYKLNAGIQEGDFDKEIKSKGAPIKHIATQWDLGPVKYIKTFKKLYNELGKPEVVHIHLNARCGIIALAAKKAGAKKIIAHSHGDIAFKSSFLKNIIYNLELTFQKHLINKYATDFWSCSILASKSLFFKPERATIINNAIDVDSFISITSDQTDKLKYELNINKETFIIGAVGRIIKRKNVSFIIDILNEYNKINSNFIFLNVGIIEDEDYMNEIISKINKYKLQDKVINYGLTANVPLIMSLFDVFLSPAHNEAFGMVAAEAQAAGVPCLLSTEFPKEIDLNLNLVTFINSFQATAWSKQIPIASIKKCTNKDLIKQTFVQLGFDVEYNVQQIEKFYHETK